MRRKKGSRLAFCICIDDKDMASIAAIRSSEGADASRFLMSFGGEARYVISGGVCERRGTKTSTISSPESSSVSGISVLESLLSESSPSLFVESDEDSSSESSIGSRMGRLFGQPFLRAAFSPLCMILVHCQYRISHFRKTRINLHWRFNYWRWWFIFFHVHIVGLVESSHLHVRS